MVTYKERAHSSSAPPGNLQAHKEPHCAWTKWFSVFLTTASQFALNLVPQT